MEQIERMKKRKTVNSKSEAVKTKADFVPTSVIYYYYQE